jgi:lactate permease
VPSLIASFFGQEFPSIIGGSFGLLLALLPLRFGLLMPRTVRTLTPETALPGDRPRAHVSLFHSLFPYGILIALLIAGKIVIGSRTILIPVPFGPAHSFSLFNPGFAFLIAGIAVVLLFRTSHPRLAGSACAKSVRLSLEPFAVIAAMSVFTQLMIVSGQNMSGLPSFLTVIAGVFENRFLPFIAPFIGAFGAFITGSATISNILFGNAVALASSTLSLATAKVVAVLSVGAAAGNMIALADILAAETVAGLKNHELQVIRGVAVPCFIYLALVGVIGMLVI